MRARLLKPDFFRDEQLADLPIQCRVLFQGLWCLADREGRLEDRPRRIRADVFPYDDYATEMVDQWLTMLHQHWIIRYVVDGVAVIQIVNFEKHQRCHPNEPKSVLPIAPLVNHAIPLVNRSTTHVLPNCPEAEAEAEAVPPYRGVRGVNQLNGTKPNAIAASKTALTKQQTAWFERFWEVYPRRTARKAAEAKFRTQCRSEERFAEIMGALRAQLPSMLAKEPDYRPHPATWLNQGRWMDETDEPQEATFFDGYEITGRPKCQ